MEVANTSSTSLCIPANTALHVSIYVIRLSCQPVACLPVRCTLEQSLRPSSVRCAQPAGEHIIVFAKVVRVLDHLLVEGLAGLLDLICALLTLGLALRFNTSITVLIALCLCQQLHTPGGLDIGIKFQHSTQVLERVALKLSASLAALCWIDHRLNLIAVDQPSKIDSLHWPLGYLPAPLLLTLSFRGTKYIVQLIKSSLGPNDEAADVPTGSKLKEVKLVYAADFYACDVPQGCRQAAVISIDYQRPFPVHVAPVPDLTLATPYLLARLSFFYVLHSPKSLQQFHGGLCLGHTARIIAHDQRHLWNLGNPVASGHNQSGQRTCGQSGANSIAFLLQIYLAVPPPPHFGWGKHPATAAHVAKGTLASSVSTTARNSRNT